MQPSVRQAHTLNDVAVRFSNGLEVTFEQMLGGFDSCCVPMLVDAWVHEDAQETVADAFLCIGDDPVDAWQSPHNVIKNHRLLASPWLSVSTDVPAIAVGSGPSLDEMLPTLRELQNKALIVCAHSTLDKLVTAGITPHVCTPLERLSETKTITCDVPCETYYGGLPVVPQELDLFKRHILVTGGNPVYAWANILHPGFSGGSNSGTLAAAVACKLTTGPVYLAGMDMANGHFDGYRFSEFGNDCEIMCVDGVMRPSVFFWQRNCREYSRLTKNSTIIQCAPQGAAIHGAMSGKLPDPSMLNTFVFEAKGEIDTGLEPSLVAKAKDLRNSWDGIIKKIEAAKDMNDINAYTLSITHGLLLSELFHSIYGQLSVEKRLGHKDVVIPWFKEAAAQTMRCIRGMILEATSGI